MKTDKITHALIGAGASAWCALPYLSVETPSGHDLFTALWSAIWIAIIVGIVKEYFDMRTEGNKWDWWDFACTCIGAVIVALFIVALHFGKG